MMPWLAGAIILLLVAVLLLKEGEWRLALFVLMCSLPMWACAWRDRRR
jgi:uncharacterized membrane protein